MPSIVASVPPVGGGVFMQITTSPSITSITLTRYAQSTGQTVTLYTGAPPPLYIDQGEGFITEVEYLPNDVYTYTVTDATGSASTPPLSTAATLLISQDKITEVIIKTVKAGINNLLITQPGWIKPRVYHAMQISGTPQLPIITITFDLLQQSEVPIGQMNMPETNNTIDISMMVERRYTITTYTTTVEEREFYRDALVAIFEAALFQPLQQLGQDIHHSFQAVSTQDTSTSPGLYVNDMMWIMTGAYSITVTTDYGSIDDLDLSGVIADYP